MVFYRQRILFKEVIMATTPTPPNAPSKTGGKSGPGRGNNPPKK